MKSKGRIRPQKSPVQRFDERRDELQKTGPNPVLQLQAKAGNRAISRLVAQRDLQAGEPSLVEQPAAESPSPADRGYIVEGAQPPSRAGGKRLPIQLRAEMEQTFSARFDNVKVHENAKMAEVLQSKAFTFGNDIYFQAGRYQPNSGSGRQILAHELTHVMQQRSGRVRAPEGDGMPVNTDRALESEAERDGRHAAWRVPVKVKGSRNTVRRPVDMTAQAHGHPPLRSSSAE